MKTLSDIQPQPNPIIASEEYLRNFADFFKALSEPLRIRILYLLIRTGELCVCDLITALAVPQSVVSRHLAYLRRYHLIRARRAGVWMHYQVTTQDTFTEQLLTLLIRNASLATACAADLERLTQSSVCC